MTLAEKVSEVPMLHARKDRSTACLLRDAGLLEAPQALNVADLEDALRHKPALADRWLERGRDQLLAGGWGIECEHGQYRVQSFSSGRHLIEKEKMHAVAQFIVRYVGFIADVMRQHKGSHRSLAQAPT